MQGRSFCPLILYHDKPLALSHYPNKHHNRIVIDRHRDRTNEMMEHNAQYWADRAGLAYEHDKEIKVTPSTSTTSNLSSSSSTSGDSVVTIDTPSSHINNIRSSVDELSAGYPHSPPELFPTHHPSHHHHLRAHHGFHSLVPSISASNHHHKYQQKSMVADPTKKRRRGNLPKEVTEFLRKWLIQHKKHPYPAEKEKADLANQTGLTVNQISNWFINARRRILQPILESETSAQLMNYPDMIEPASSYDRHRRHDFYSYNHPRQDIQSSTDDNKQRFVFRRTKIVEINDTEEYYQLSGR